MPALPRTGGTLQHQRCTCRKLHAKFVGCSTWTNVSKSCPLIRSAPESFCQTPLENAAGEWRTGSTRIWRWLDSPWKGAALEHKWLGLSCFGRAARISEAARSHGPHEDVIGALLAYMEVSSASSSPTWRKSPGTGARERGARAFSYPRRWRIWERMNVGRAKVHAIGRHVSEAVIALWQSSERDRGRTDERESADGCPARSKILVWLA